MKKIASAAKEYERSTKRRETQQATINKQDVLSKKLHDPCYIGFSESRTCTILSKLTAQLLQFYSVSNPNIILAAYSFGESYSQHLYSETFVILYGEDGLVLMNWNF